MKNNSSKTSNKSGLESFQFSDTSISMSTSDLGLPEFKPEHLRGIEKKKEHHLGSRCKVR